MHSLIYDKSLYAEFWGLNSEFGIFCLIVCSNFINTVYKFLHIESIHLIPAQGYVPYKYINRKDCKWYVFICRRNLAIGNIPYQEGPFTIIGKSKHLAGGSALPSHLYTLKYTQRSHKAFSNYKKHHI